MRLDEPPRGDAVCSPWPGALRHDLSNPLHVLSGFLELLSEEIGGSLNELQRTYVEEMRLAVGRALEVAERIPDQAQ